MGIDGIDILKPDEFTPAPQVRERKAVSQHIVVDQQMKYVFGWDQPLISFYLQVHDLTRPENDQIIVWLGSEATTTMYEVEDLVRAAAKNGLIIGHNTQRQLYAEKDNGV